MKRSNFLNLGSFRFLLAATAISSLVGCQDPIDLELPEGTKRPIVNARITDEDSVTAEVYWTASYLTQAPNEPVSNAVLVLLEDGVVVDTLRPIATAPGRYKGTKIGTEGKSYRLRFWMPGDPKPWVSGPETVRRCPLIDSIYSEKRPREAFQLPGRYSLLHFTEPAGRGDQYRFKVWRNDTLENLPFNITFFDDQFNDGLSFNNVEFPAVDFAGPDSVGTKYRVEISSISPGLLQFLTLLRQTTLQVGTPFDPAPGLVAGNLWREENPDEFALGYFYASGVSRASLVIQP
mgnify:CR=1 FL=1|jgi:hypothetical protein